MKAICNVKGIHFIRLTLLKESFTSMDEWFSDFER